MLKDKIKQMLELPDEVLEQAYNILYGEGTNYAHKPEHIRNLLTTNRALLATLPSVYEMLNFLESHLPKQGQDLERIFDRHQSLGTLDFEEFKQAVAELQQPKQSPNEMLKVCDLCLKSEIEDVVSGKSDENLVINDVQYIKPKESKFPRTDEEIKAKIEELKFNEPEYGFYEYDKDSLILLAKWLKGEK